MATTVYVRDTENYPSNQKTMTVDLTQLVPVGVSGDEKWVVPITTTAYSNNTSSTAINDVYIRNLYRGWAKSSGLVGGSFTITGANRKLAVSIDDNSAPYIIRLTTGTGIPGDTVAEDMQTKLRALSDTGGDQVGDLGYLNCEVEFVDNKFWIYSGTISNSWTSSSRSSVEIADASTGDGKDDLGFDVVLDSYNLASNPCQVTKLSAEYAGDAATMGIDSPAWTVASGQAYMVTDGTNTEYFTILAGSNQTTLNVPDFATNAFAAVINTYAAGSMVVLLTRGDEDYPVATPFRVIDDAVRWGVMTVVNQIDFSS